MGSEGWAGLGVLVGLGVAFCLARRSGKRRMNAALAQAHASGRAELTAELQQIVAVNVPVNFHQHASLGGASLGPGWTTDDDYEPSVDAGVLAAVAALDKRAAALHGIRVDYPALDHLGDAGPDRATPPVGGGPARFGDRGDRGLGRGPGH